MLWFFSFLTVFLFFASPLRAVPGFPKGGRPPDFINLKEAEKLARALHLGPLEKYVSERTQARLIRTFGEALVVQSAEVLHGAIHGQLKKELFYEPFLKKSKSAFAKNLESALTAEIIAEEPESIGSVTGRVAGESMRKQLRSLLPSEQFRQLKNRVLDIPVLNLPNSVYGGILAASAAMHLTKAFAGPKVDLLELRRAKQVIAVMVWQLKNREYVTLGLGDFVDIAYTLEKQVGDFNWGGLEKVKTWGPGHQIRKQIGKFEREIRRIEKETLEKGMETLGPAGEALRGLEKELRGFSGNALEPLIRPVTCFLPGECGLEGMDIATAMPPATTPVLKKLAAVVARVLPGPSAEIPAHEAIPFLNPSDISDFDPVTLHNGEFFLTADDLLLPSPGFDLVFRRTYRSRSRFLGVLGQNWTHNWAERLLLWESPGGPGMTYVDDAGKKFFFRQSAGRFLPPAGMPAVLEEREGIFRLTFKNGLTKMFDGRGFLTAVWDAAGHEQVFAYDEAGHLRSVRDTAGRRHRLHYRDDGFLEKLEEFSGRIWRFDYDDRQRLVAVTAPATPSLPEGRTSRFHYEDDKLILAMNPKGDIWLQNYYGRHGEDAGKIVAQIYGNEDDLIEARYDGLNAWVKDRLGRLHRYEHNTEGALIRHSILDGEGRWREISAPANPVLPRERWDNPYSLPPRGGGLGWGENPTEEHHNFYDANGNLLRAETPEGETVGNFKFDILDRQTAANGVRFDYDPLGRLTRVLYPDGETESYAYDLRDEVTAMKNREGEEVRFEYDASGRVTRATRGGLSLERRYDGEGRLAGEGWDGRWVRTDYDADGRVSGIRYPGGLQVVYQYDEQGTLKEIFAGRHRFAPSEEAGGWERVARWLEGDETFRDTYDPLGRLVLRESLDGERRLQIAYDGHRLLEVIENGELREAFIYGECFVMSAPPPPSPLPQGEGEILIPSPLAGEG